MKKAIFTGLLSLFWVSSIYAGDNDIRGQEKDAPLLSGYATQGGILYGEIKGWDIYKCDNKNKKAERLNKDNVFVIGLGRDEPEILKLCFCEQKNKDSCQTYTYKITQRKYLEQKVSVPDKYIKYPDDVKKRIDLENAEIIRGRSAAGNDMSLEFMNISAPLDLKKYRISSVFGSRRVFNGVPKSPHKGIDLAAPKGTVIYASASGKILISTDMYMSGNTVFISHGHGITSAYLHMDKIDVKNGEQISKGDRIGTVGSTGRSSGAHLHFGIYWNQIALDPELFIKKR